MLQKIKYYIPFELAGIRAISFIPLILSTFGIVSIPIILQIILACIIIGSDIFDGMISRKTFTPKEQLCFRLTDTIIDKTGIISCLLGLLSTAKIPIPYFISLICYHTLLLGGGTLFLKTATKKEEKTIQGLFISRLFTAMVGISILLCNNINLTPLFGNLLTLGMGLLGMTSLTEQFLDKYKQRKESHSSIRLPNTTQMKKRFITAEKYLSIFERRMMTHYSKNTSLDIRPSVKKDANPLTSLEFDHIFQTILQGFHDIEFVLSENAKTTYQKQRTKNKILSQVPEILFDPPYSYKDVFDYISSHKIIEVTLQELHEKLEQIKITIGMPKQPLLNETPSLRKIPKKNA